MRLLLVFLFSISLSCRTYAQEPAHVLVIGTGYVGLVTGVCFAELGHHVTCLDIDQEKINTLHNGKIPFFEPALEDLVKKNTKLGRLLFTTDYTTSVLAADVCFIAVPTPSTEDGACDIHFILDVAGRIAFEMNHPMLIVNKSTAPSGTVQKIKEKVQQTLQKLGKKIPFEVASNPEFLKEGSAVNDCMHPDRIIIGADTKEAAVQMKQLYACFNLREEQILVMDLPSAEMTKYAANAMLASRISFMNELAGLCEKVGANIDSIRIGIGSDPRIGSQFLYAGIGYGGSCFPKDVRALKAMGQQMHYETPLFEAIDNVNCRQRKVLTEKMRTYYGDLAGKTIAIWGLAFKPNTDDMREAPSLDLIEELLSQGATVRLYDPIAMEKAKKNLHAHPRLQWCTDPYDAAKGADGIALVTEWKQFLNPDFATILKTMQGKAFFDGRNQYPPQEMHQKGFDYFGIGISPSRQAPLLKVD